MKYKYFKRYMNETNRPEWMIYIDHLLEMGRLYPAQTRNTPDYMCLSNDEHRRLTSLMFQDNSLSTREEIMTDFNRDELSNAIISYIESDSIDAEKRIAKIIAGNVCRYHELPIVEIFEEIRREQGIENE